MPQKKFHLGWFLSFNAPAWDLPTSGDVGRTWPTGEFHIEMARNLERAGFDFMMLEDSSKVPNVYRGSSETDLAYGLFAPKNDPVLLVPAIGRETEHIGLIVTMSTSFYPPYILARSTATMSHLTGGRSGWNMVTSSGDVGAQNFNMDQLPPHDQRYEVAEEFAEVVTRLWDSWEPDALVMDAESHRYVDHTKVHTIDHKGAYFQVRGPLTTLPVPGGRPVICQAGGSAHGRDFSARYADVIVCAAQGAAAMRAYREDIRERAAKAGRDPDDIKVMFVVEPHVAETEAEAQAAMRRRYELTEVELEYSLAYLSTHTEVDFSTLDLDAPLPEMTTNGHQTSLKSLYGMGDTVREVASTWWHHYINEDLVGTPDQVAEAMGSLMQEVGGDGFLLNNHVLTREYIASITDLLVPALRARGLTRTEYQPTLRESLREF